MDSNYQEHGDLIIVLKESLLLFPISATTGWSSLIAWCVGERIRAIRNKGQVIGEFGKSNWPVRDQIVKPAEFYRGLHYEITTTHKSHRPIWKLMK